MNLVPPLAGANFSILSLAKNADSYGWRSSAVFDLNEAPSGHVCVVLGDPGWLPRAMEPKPLRGSTAPKGLRSLALGNAQGSVRKTTCPEGATLRCLSDDLRAPQKRHVCFAEPRRRRNIVFCVEHPCSPVAFFQNTVGDKREGPKR